MNAGERRRGYFKATGGLVLAVGAALLALMVVTLVRHSIHLMPGEDVRFESGDITLAGRFVRPGAEGRSPAVIMLHGSGPETRAGIGSQAVARALLRAGYAVLLYDKRGTGDSEGDFRASYLTEFAADAAAAIDYVRTRADVDPRRVGLFAVSESGWFAPRVAMTAGVSFLICQVCPTSNWIDTVAFEHRNDLLAAGATPEAVDEYVELWIRSRRYYAAAAEDPTVVDGPMRRQIDQAHEAVRARDPAAADFVPAGLDSYGEVDHVRWARRLAFDPARDIPDLTIPLLYVYGQTDVNIPTRDSVAVLQRWSDARPDLRVTVHEFEGVGHSLATPRGLWNAGFAPGYLELVESWSAAERR